MNPFAKENSSPTFVAVALPFQKLRRPSRRRPLEAFHLQPGESALHRRQSIFPTFGSP